MKIKGYEITAAIYANKEHTSALLTTTDCGVIAVSTSWDGWEKLTADFDIADFDVQAHDNDIRRSEIISQLEAIDLQTVRPLRASIQNIATAQDLAKLEQLENEAQALREELATL